MSTPTPDPGLWLRLVDAIWGDDYELGAAHAAAHRVLALPELEQLRQLTAAAIAYHEMPASSWWASSSSPNEQARAAATQAFREAIAALGPVVRVWAGEQT